MQIYLGVLPSIWLPTRHAVCPRPVGSCCRQLSTHAPGTLGLEVHDNSQGPGLPPLVSRPLLVAKLEASPLKCLQSSRPNCGPSPKHSPSDLQDGLRGGPSRVRQKPWPRVSLGKMCPSRPTALKALPRGQTARPSEARLRQTAVDGTLGTRPPCAFTGRWFCNVNLRGGFIPRAHCRPLLPGLGAELGAS